MRRIHGLSLLLCVVVSPVLADDTAEAPSSLLGPKFGGAYDVSFRPFAGGERLPAENKGQIARFVREDKKWALVFDRAELPDPQPLKDFRNDQNQPQAGYLSLAINKLRSSDPQADVLRQEPLDSGDLQTGVIVAVTHDKKTGTPVLLQEALMQVNSRLYYGLVMTCPIDNADASKSPAAREASTVFKAVLDSIERVDQTALRQDQDERLFRTRALFAAWNKAKLLSALVPEQYLRIRQKGRDVGYAYVVEQPADAVPKAGESVNGQAADTAAATGVRVGLRSHTAIDGKAVDTENFMFVTFDRRHEVWTSKTRVDDPTAKRERDKKTWFSEVGSSDHKEEREFDHSLNHDDFKDFDSRSKNDPKNDGGALPFRMRDRYSLSVTGENVSAVDQPFTQDLPPFYLPEALSALLPRLVPLDTPTGYLFATFQSEGKKVIFQYVDVGVERAVTLDGKQTRGVPVAVRIGFSGTPTTYYLTPKGQYLGSVNEEAKIEVTPADRATLENVWKGANLTAPAAK